MAAASPPHFEDMLNTTSVLVGLLGGVAAAGFAGWLISRWLGLHHPPSSAGTDPIQAQLFASVAQQALAQNSGTFLQLVRTELDGQFGREREALSGAVAPLKDSLTQVQGLLRSIEEDRNKAYGSLESNLKNLFTAVGSLQQETTTLSSALRNPQARGRWGEVALRRLVELSGMTEHCDFDTQVTLSGIEERLRPDLVIHLPSGRVVPVDSPESRLN